VQSTIIHMAHPVFHMPIILHGEGQLAAKIKGAHLVVTSQAYLQMRGLFYKLYESILSITKPLQY